MKSLKFFIFLCLFFTLQSVNGQVAPVNDVCASAIDIGVSSKGFDLGTFLSVPTQLKDATREVGEMCSESSNNIGNCGKTVWYKFKLGTNREVALKLRQKDSLISEVSVGFSIYKVDNCAINISHISNKLTSINKFGTSGNMNLDGGWYYVQVGANSKVKGLIWIELNISKVPSDTFDTRISPLVLDNSETVKLASGNGIDSLESGINGVGAEDKSIWFKYTIPENLQSFKWVITPSNYLQNVRSVVFDHPPTEYEVAAITDFNAISRLDNTVHQVDNTICQSETVEVKTLYVVVFYQDVSPSSYSPYFSSRVVYDDKNDEVASKSFNNSLTPDKLVLDWGDRVETDVTFSCEALLSRCHCKPTIPDSFGSGAGKYQYAAYFVVELLHDGKLYFGDGPGVSKKHLLTLYKGDITQNCELDSITQFSTGSYCLQQGIYTVIYAHVNRSKENSGSSSIIRLDEYDPAPGAFLTPQNSENLGVLNPLETNQIYGIEVNHRPTDTTVIVDGVTITGKVSFKEFELSETGSLTIYGKSCRMFLFEGSIADNKAKKLSGLDYEYAQRYFGYKQNLWFGGEKKCFVLEEGNYSLVCIDFESNSNYQCDQHSFEVRLIGHGACGLRNTAIEFALPINQSKNVLEVCDTLSSMEYELSISICNDCVTPKSKKLIGICDFIQDSITHYYTFKTEESLSVNVGYSSVIYNGDVIADPSLVLDSNNIINPCKMGVICNLPGNQIYTLVVMGEVKTAKLTFTKHIRPTSDFIGKAYDFGVISENSSQLSSLHNFSCHSNGLNSDLNNLFSNYESPNNYFKTYPDTPFVIRDKDYRGASSWFTFTTDGNIGIEFQLLTPNLNSTSSDIYIYEYLGPFTLDFSELLDVGLDTSKHMFKQHRLNKYRPTQANNLACQQKRYFVQVLRNGSSNYQYYLRINGGTANTYSQGDFCDNANTLEIKDYGLFEISGNNNCHSYGNSPFEEINKQNVASTWFEIDATELEKFDLGVSVSGSDGFSIFAGDCGALTKLLDVSDGGSFVSLSCMGTGKYYVRVEVPGNILAFSNFILKVQIDSVSIACKPYSFKKPIAHFQISGGCHTEDTIHLQNYSSRGEDMRFMWYVNEVLLDSALDVKINRRDAILSDSNEFKLIATNAFTGLSDTTYHTYIRDTTSYTFKITGKNEAFCHDELLLGVSTDYPEKLNYRWSEVEERHRYFSVLSYDSIYQKAFTPAWNYYVYASSDNCNFLDSFKVDLIKPFRVFYDSTVCSSDKIVFTENDTLNFYSLNGFSVSGNTINLADSGRYIISYRYKYCGYADTVEVSYYPDNQKKKLFYCFDKDEILLDAGIAQNYFWEDDESSSSQRYVNTYGKYNVIRNTINDCIDTLAFSIENDCAFDVYIPNAFTPGDNNLNEAFMPIFKSEGVRYQMEIFSRWGELLFSTSKSELWDGKYQGNVVKSGAYLYLITATEKSGKIHQYKGTISVVR